LTTFRQWTARNSPPRFCDLPLPLLHPPILQFSIDLPTSKFRPYALTTGSPFFPSFYNRAPPLPLFLPTKVQRPPLVFFFALFFMNFCQQHLVLLVFTSPERVSPLLLFHPAEFYEYRKSSFPRETPWSPFKHLPLEVFLLPSYDFPLRYSLRFSVGPRRSFLVKVHLSSWTTLSS